MHRLWGGDLIGMTAMPEAKLAKEAEISYALIALVTDYDCWRNKPAIMPPGTDAASAGPQPAKPDPHELLREIIANVQAATQNAVDLMKRAVELAGQRRDQLAAAPAQRALELAIWSDKSRIDPDEVQRLAPLWVKYFENAPQ
jgi:5'-methylthioadenosine phosphorylase